MKDFCIIANPQKDKGHRLAKQMKSYIELKGGICRIISDSDHIPASPEGILVLGGDGTLIRAARMASEKGIPLIGVNMGHLGYLCELEEENVCHGIEEMMLGNYIIEDRMMLSGQADKKEARLPQNALNDIVILRKGALQLIELIVSVNGGYLNTYRADGIILATPTGSTGYSMSAGGPIVDPKARMLLITPVNAHELNAKSIVVGAEDEVTIQIGNRQQKEAERVDVNFDGELALELSSGDAVTIRASRQVAKIIKLSKISFLEMLRKKMNVYS